MLLVNNYLSIILKITVGYSNICCIYTDTTLYKNIKINYCVFIQMQLAKFKFTIKNLKKKSHNCQKEILILLILGKYIHNVN